MLIQPRCCFHSFPKADLFRGIHCLVKIICTMKTNSSLLIRKAFPFGFFATISVISSQNPASCAKNRIPSISQDISQILT